MIENNALGDKLKEFKNKQLPPNSDIPTNPKTQLLDSIYTVFAGVMSIAKVFVFGYTAKIIFSTDWNILGIICVGLTTNILLTYIRDLIYPE
jgi:hypothetical protein